MNYIINYKILYISILIIIICCINSCYAQAQFFDSEQNPPSVKWQQINTANFQIIYPTTFENEAQRMANTLQSIISKVGQTLHKEPRKISIILQNQGVESNGFVQLAPRRSEFFTTPSQEFDYQDWLNSLAVHELRHVVQFEKLTGNLKAPFFEELGLAIFGITLPPWFYEGDAVDTETTLTNAGRGRLPSWELTFRTNTLNNRLYSYSKDYFGSVRDQTPGYYQLGYFMATKLRRDYGKNIMDSLFTHMSHNPIRPYNLSRSIKKYTGLNTRQLHDSTVAELSRLWKQQFAEVKPLNYAALNNRKNKVPTDYLLPVAVSPTEILVLKQGVAQTPQLILMDTNGGEQNILHIGYQENPDFSYADHKIVWDEFRFDTRFHKRSYNVVNIYDMVSKTYHQLTHKTRLFSPSLSPDGKTIAAVQVTLSNIINVVELDAKTGKELKIYPNPLNLILQTPTYNAVGDKLVLTATNKEGQTICEISRAESSFIQLLPFQQQQLSKPTYVLDKILFRAHYNGLDNIYSFNKITQEIKQLTSAQFGAYNPTYDASTQRILFNNYQVNGYDIASVPYSNELGIGPEKSNTFINYFQPLINQEGSANVFASIDTLKYKSKSYKELNNLFYFHSLVPILEANDLNNDLNSGLKIQSNNKLNTLDFYTGYQFNSALKRSEYLAGFTYKHFFPILDVKYINRAKLGYAKQIKGTQTTLIPINWRENFTDLALTFPFIFNQRNYTYSCGLQTSTSYTYIYDTYPSNYSIQKIKFPIKYQVYLNRNSNRSARDLAAKWGQNITLSYQSLPFENQLKGDLFTLKSTFFAPGILPNHSTQIRFNYQYTNGVYNYAIDIPQVSGYAHLTPHHDLQNTLLLNYRFPLFYPDLEIGPLAYVKRLKGGFFANFENVGINKENTLSPRTYGFELSADMNLLRFYLPNFDLGGKLIFINEKSAQNPIFEIGFTYSY